MKNEHAGVRTWLAQHLHRAAAAVEETPQEAGTLEREVRERRLRTLRLMETIVMSPSSLLEVMGDARDLMAVEASHGLRPDALIYLQHAGLREPVDAPAAWLARWVQVQAGIHRAFVALGLGVADEHAAFAARMDAGCYARSMFFDLLVPTNSSAVAATESLHEYALELSVHHPAWTVLDEAVTPTDGPLGGDRIWTSLDTDEWLVSLSKSTPVATAFDTLIDLLVLDQRRLRTLLLTASEVEARTNATIAQLATQAVVTTVEMEDTAFVVDDRHLHAYCLMAPPRYPPPIEDEA